MSTSATTAFLIPILLWILGGIWIYRGIRGVAVLSDPKCAKCGYDLRWVDPKVNVTCPECGADLKARHAVRFGERQRQPRYIVLGLAVMLLPFALVFALRFSMVAGRQRVLPTTLTNQAIIARLSTTADQPWDWQELERRYTQGKLSNQEAAAAIDALIKYLPTRRGGLHQPLHWCDKFLSTVDAGGAISNEQLGRLAATFYGQPTIRMRPRVHPGTPLMFEIERSNSWPLMGLQSIRALCRVTLDAGQELIVYEPYGADSRPISPDSLSKGNGMSISGKLLPEANPGKHQVTFELDEGVVAQNAEFRTLSGSPGQARYWPKTRHKWSPTISVPIEVVPADVPVIELVTDAALDPMQNGQISATAGLYSHSEGGPAMKLRLTCKALQVPLSCAVSVQAGGNEIAQTSLSLSPGSGSWSTTLEVSRLGSDMTAVDVILKPAPDRAETDLNVERIWGKEIILRGVPLERLDDDVEAAQPTATSAQAIIARLGTTGDLPRSWNDWNELQRLYTQSKLSNQEAAAAVDALIKYLQTHPAGPQQQLPWAESFLSALDVKGSISDEQLGRLVAAFYPQPTIRMRPRAHANKPLRFEIEGGNPRPLLKCRPVLTLRRVTLDDGQELKVYDPYGREGRPTPPHWLSPTGSSPIHGRLMFYATTGKHRLAFELDAALVPENAAFRTPSGAPGQARNWPKARHQWSPTVIVPTEIVPSDIPVVELVTDAAFDPVRNRQFFAELSFYNDPQGTPTIELQMTRQELTLALICSASVQVGGSEVARTSVFIMPGSGTSRTSLRARRLGRDITAIDLVLKPAPDRAETATDVERIWGKEIILRGVPLERLDDDAAGKGPASTQTSSAPAAN